MNLTTYSLTTGGPAFSSSATQQHRLGTQAYTRNGCTFRYVQAGELLVTGTVVQAPAQLTNHQVRTPTVTTYGAVGDTRLVVTLGNTAAAANLYTEGWAIVDTTPGLGYMYAITYHAAVLANGVITAHLAKDTPIQVALTTDSRISFQQNPWKNVIIAPTTLTGTIVGVAVYPIASGEYGWVQTGGPGSVLQSEVVSGAAVGAMVVGKTTGVAGGAAIFSSTFPVVGTMMVTAVDTLNQAVFLQLD